MQGKTVSYLSFLGEKLNRTQLWKTGEAEYNFSFLCHEILSQVLQVLHNYMTSLSRDLQLNQDVTCLNQSNFWDQIVATTICNHFRNLNFIRKLYSDFFPIIQCMYFTVIQKNTTCTAFEKKTIESLKVDCFDTANLRLFVCLERFLYTANLRLVFAKIVSSLWRLISNL